jgi:hypothetical protein
MVKKMTLAELRQQKEAIGQKREKKKRLKKKLDEEMVKLDRVEAHVDEGIALLEAAPWHGPMGEAEDESFDLDEGIVEQLKRSEEETVAEWMEELVKKDQVSEEERSVEEADGAEAPLTTHNKSGPARRARAARGEVHGAGRTPSTQG